MATVYRVRDPNTGKVYRVRQAGQAAPQQPQSDVGFAATEREIGNRASVIEEAQTALPQRYAADIQEAGGNPILGAINSLGKIPQRLPEDVGRGVGITAELTRGIPAVAGLAMQQDRPILSDMAKLFTGQRPAQVGDIMRAAGEPGTPGGEILSSAPMRFAANNVDILGAARSINPRMIEDIPKAGQMVMQKGRDAGASISKGLERFGLKQPKQFPVNPSLDDLAIMKAADRKEYFQVRKYGMESKITEQLTNEQNQLRAAGEQLASQVESASRDAVLKARPAMAKVMGEASPTWRKLIQEGLDEADDIPIPHVEIQEELSKRFGGDPSMVNRALQEINVNVPSRTSIDPLMGTQVQPYSAKEVWSRLNQERLSMPAAKRAGTAVYGESEFFKDSVVEALSNILHRRGVNLSKANQFWAPYANLRNSVFKQIKPFIKEPYQLESGQRLFKGAAQGKGKVAEVADLEARAGEDFTGNLRELYKKRDDVKFGMKQSKEKAAQGIEQGTKEIKLKAATAEDKAEALARTRKQAKQAGGALISAGGLTGIAGWLSSRK